MHPRTEHLLSLRDREPVGADVREHVAGCSRCTSQITEAADLRDQLRALPQAAADARSGGWQDVRRRMAERAATVQRRSLAARLAVAASIAVIAVAIAWRASDPAATPPATVVAHYGRQAVEDAIALDRVAQLQTQSQALDEMLSALGEQPAIERAGAAMPIDTLEARVQWLDHQLSTGGDSIAAKSAEHLWRERVELMNSLVQLRYVEAQRISM
jgi:hypothetical protein